MWANYHTVLLSNTMFYKPTYVEIHVDTYN